MIFFSSLYKKTNTSQTRKRFFRTVEVVISFSRQQKKRLKGTFMIIPGIQNSVTQRPLEFCPLGFWNKLSKKLSKLVDPNSGKKFEVPEQQRRRRREPLKGQNHICSHSNVALLVQLQIWRSYLSLKVHCFSEYTDFYGTIFALQLVRIKCQEGWASSTTPVIFFCATPGQPNKNSKKRGGVCVWLKQSHYN